MLAQRRIPARVILSIGLMVLTYQGVWSATVIFLYSYAGWGFLRVPFLPVATVGTAVAFYVGFKNNSSYDRFWEGRKIWGGIVNVSRTWANAVLSYVDEGADSLEAQQARKQLVYRQLAWINSLRVQLRSRSRFVDNGARATKRRLDRDADVMRNDWDKEVGPFLPSEELHTLKGKVNAATQLLRTQGAELTRLHKSQRLDLFKQIELMNLVEQLYTLQGQCERIKNTPFPRQYAEFSRWFTRVFIFLLPCGLLDVFNVPTGAFTNQTLLHTVVPMLLSAGAIAWVFVTMEGVGDASEDPFERSINDVPMNALCVTIERDLRQMLGETELPEPEKPADFVLY